MIYRCKNQLKTFNRRSAEMKSSALSVGMTIINEWIVDGFECFHAEATQADCKRGTTVWSECGACINNNPRVWSTMSGKIDEQIFLQVEVKQS